MKIQEINEQIAQDVIKNLPFNPTYKKMIKYKTAKLCVDQKLEDAFTKYKIKEVYIWDTSINLIMDYDYDFTDLKNIIYNIYKKENYELKHNDIKDILINYGKYNNEKFYRIFVVKKDNNHTKSIKLDKRDIKELTYFYPEMINLFTENMAQFDEYTSQSLQIITDRNLITFKDYETLPKILKNMNNK